MDKIQVKALEKILFYILNHHPDEFGLVVDASGWTPLKDLVRALQEEPGWGFLRLGYLAELLTVLAPERFELSADGQKVRAAAKVAGPRPGAKTITPPTSLYMAVRRRGYPHLLEKGLRPTQGQDFLVAARTEAMALRLGKRRDPEPVLIKIDGPRAAGLGVVFRGFLDELVLLDFLPAEAVSGPPLPKVRDTSPAKPKKKVSPPDQGLISFLDGEPLSQAPSGKRPSKPKGKEAWKENRKRPVKKEWF